MKNVTRVGMFTVVLGVAAAGAMAQQGHQHEQAKPQKGQQAHQQTGDFDLRFLDMTAMHHEMGVRMSEMAEEKAQNAELKAKAKQMLDDQRREIEQADQLRSRLYPDAAKRQSASEMMESMHGKGTSGQAGGEHQHEGMVGMHLPGMDMSGMMGEMHRLEKLEGVEFDRAFAKMMIQHHQMQVKMSQRALQEAKHDEVQKLAKETLERQKQDIADLQRLAGSGKAAK